MNYDLVILTTACSRSKLHNISFGKIKNFLKGYKCKWVIRIDQIKDELPEITSENFKKILSSDNIDLEIYTSERTAGRISWFKTVKFCINEGYKYNPKIGYFWLEDDWIQNSDVTLKELLNNNSLPKSYFLSLANRKGELNFNPSIWSPDLYKKYMYDKINNAVMPYDGGNAERACTYIGDSTGKNLKPEPCNSINMFTLNVFKDIGRDWAKNNISKERTFYY